MDQEDLLKIKDLHVEFSMKQGTVHALRGVDLNISKGTTIGLVGESGCGKSMTARAMMGLVPEPGEVTKGEILLNLKSGEFSDIVKLKRDGKEIRKIRGQELAMVFQEPMTAFSPVHTIGNQIMEAILLHQDVNKNEAKEIAIETLESVGLPDARRQLKAYPFELSGGMRQRAMIAMALVCKPRLLIADEATTALDVTIQAQILDLLQSIQEEMDMSILVVTHNLGVIATITERVNVMYLGRMVEEGSTEQIFDNPKHPYTKGLMGAVPEIGSKLKGETKRLETIPGVVPDPFLNVPGCLFHLRCPEFIEGKCDNEIPKEIEVEKGHSVRCFLYEKEINEGGMNLG